MSKGRVDGLVDIVSPSEVSKDNMLGDFRKIESGGGACVIIVIPSKELYTDGIADVMEREGGVIAVSEACESCGEVFDVVSRTSSELVWPFGGPTRLVVLKSVAVSVASGGTVEFAPLQAQMKSTINLKRSLIIRHIRVLQIRYKKRCSKGIGADRV